MHYTIIGLRETGELAVYDRSSPEPSLASAEQICYAFDYTQLLVLENKQGGYAKRYEYSHTPNIREVPMKRDTAKEESAS